MKYKILKDKVIEIRTAVALFGATEAFNTELHERCQQIGSAVCSELGITKEEAMRLPDDTELTTPEVTDKFEALAAWFKKENYN